MEGHKPRIQTGRAALKVIYTELGLKSVKCFGCHKKGHVVSEFPDKKNKESARMIHAEGMLFES